MNNTSNVMKMTDGTIVNITNDPIIVDCALGDYSTAPEVLSVTYKGDNVANMTDLMDLYTNGHPLIIKNGTNYYEPDNYSASGKFFFYDFNSVRWAFPTYGQLVGVGCVAPDNYGYYELILDYDNQTLTRKFNGATTNKEVIETFFRTHKTFVRITDSSISATDLPTVIAGKVPANNKLRVFAIVSNHIYQYDFSFSGTSPQATKTTII